MQKIKKCYKCKEVFPETDFNKNKAKKDNLQTSCKGCQRKIAKKYYELNRKRCIGVININKRRRALGHYIEIITNYLNVPCTDCRKVYHPASMVFDHKVGSIKNIYKNQGVNYLIRDGYSKESITDEIKKCDVRCQNCHYLKTSKDFKHWKEISSLINDYSRIIKKLYRKHWNFFDFDTFKIQKKEISEKFANTMLEKASLEIQKKKEKLS
tara:strand:+ start:1720 stop:2352 length:633 start_codon:yes stop_codon:yes gene_type:complete